MFFLHFLAPRFAVVILLLPVAVVVVVTTDYCVD